MNNDSDNAEALQCLLDGDYKAGLELIGGLENLSSFLDYLSEINLIDVSIDVKASINIPNLISRLDTER